MANKRFAPVAPVSVLNYLAKHNELGGYHLVLAHNVVDHGEEFFKLFHTRRWDNPTIIVDNSVIELGKPVEASVIKWAVEVFEKCGLSANREVVAVLPDELLDMKGTIRTASVALADFRRRGLRNLMFVPQGQTFDEIIECAEAFQHVDEIKWIGVARNLARLLGSRERITQVLQAIFPDRRFHMLGFSDDLVDDMLCARLPGVAGIDSAVPLRLKTDMHLTMKYPRRGDWWKEDMEGTDQMITNVRQVRKWLS